MHVLAIGEIKVSLRDQAIYKITNEETSVFVLLLSFAMALIDLVYFPSVTRELNDF